MKTLATTTLLTLGLIANAGIAQADVFDDLKLSAPRSVFDDLRDAAPKSVFDQIRDATPRSVWDQLNDSAPRTDGVFGDLQKSAP